MTETQPEQLAAPAVRLARFFHETYEELAPEHGYETREESAKPWEEVPEQNRALMIAVADRVMGEFFQLAGEEGDLYAIPGVGRESGEAIVTLQWGAMTGQVDPDAARTLGMGLIEAAELAAVEALMLAWLTRDGDGDKTGAARILEGFRQFRAAEAAVEEPA